MKRPVEFLPKGWPDDMLLIRGRLAGLELKSKNDRLRHDQAKMARNWRCAGIPIVYPRTGDDLLELLAEVFPPEVLAPPAEEEWALYREAISKKWKDDPKGWLRHHGWLPAGV